MAQPEGWIREDMLRWKRWIPLITVRDEDSDVIAVEIGAAVLDKRMVNAIGINSSQEELAAALSFLSEFEGENDVEVIVELVDLVTGLRPEATAYTITLTEGGDGTVTAGSGTAFIKGAIDATTGRLQLDVTDVAGGSDQAVGLLVSVLTHVGAKAFASLTFDDS